MLAADERACAMRFHGLMKRAAHSTSRKSIRGCGHQDYEMPEQRAKWTQRFENIRTLK